MLQWGAGLESCVGSVCATHRGVGRGFPVKERLPITTSTSTISSMSGSCSFLSLSPPPHWAALPRTTAAHCPTVHSLPEPSFKRDLSALLPLPPAEPVPLVDNLLPVSSLCEGAPQGPKPRAVSSPFTGSSSSQSGLGALLFLGEAFSEAPACSPRI